MVAVFNKEHLSWYLSILKLREIVESGIPSTSASNRLLELPEQPQEKLHKQQQTPSDSLNIAIRDDGEKDCKEAAETSPEPELAISIKEKLERARQDKAAGSLAEVSIYKVPQHLREGDDKAYVPQMVSLGPYHHGKNPLCQMDSHKLRSLNRVLRRNNQDIQTYIDSMKELEEKARASYEGPVSLSSNKFVEMMVLDGCFVLEIFRGAALGFKKLGYPPYDPVFNMGRSMHLIQRDMMMLENQLPLFILDRLMRLQPGDPDEKGLVSDLALRFFYQLTPTVEPSSLTKLRVPAMIFDPLPEESELHCLHVFRRSLLRSGPQPKRRAKRVPDERGAQLIHCVTELREAGIKFRKRKTDRFWDIKFENGVLRIPGLFIHDGTKSLFLNLIAFEQCHLDCNNDITSYVSFMDCLINSPEDVGYLHYRSIIEHSLGSDAEVADLFNRLCREVGFDIKESSLYRLSEDVNRHYNDKWNGWRAILRHNYFHNPWAIISIGAAVVLLMLTLAQTFYGVYGYYHPGS